MNAPLYVHYYCTSLQELKRRNLEAVSADEDDDADMTYEAEEGEIVSPMPRSGKVRRASQVKKQTPKKVSGK